MFCQYCLGTCLAVLWQSCLPLPGSLALAGGRTRRQPRQPPQPLTTPHNLRYSTPMATRWSDDDRATALALYIDHGPAEASRRTGIPTKTISSWARRTGTRTDAPAKTAAAVAARAAQWAELRETVANESGRTARRILAIITDALDNGHLEVSTVHQAKDAATTMAILVDKAQVLVGDASAITGHVGLREQVAAQAETSAPRLRAVS